MKPDHGINGLSERASKLFKALAFESARCKADLSLHQAIAKKIREGGLKNKIDHIMDQCSSLQNKEISL